MQKTSVAELLRKGESTVFSIEILPPLRGKSISGTFSNLDKVMDYGPAYVNITTHRNEVVYRQVGDGIFRTFTAQRRPGSVAIAAAIKGRYSTTVVPHLICGQYTRQEIEDQLIDLSYLGITDVLALRGDAARETRVFDAARDGHLHAESLCRQIVDFNNGKMVDGTETEAVIPPFSFGVAGYPEKHDEAMNLTTDIEYLRRKVDAGAEYIVTQMFFDNRKFFAFEERCRQAGITVPIVPGLKPLTSLRQMSLLPKTFHIDFPEALAEELVKCENNDQVKALGVEWTTVQAKELKAHGVPSLHFYSLNAMPQVAEILNRVF